MPDDEPLERPLVSVGDITFDLYGQRTQPDIDVSSGQQTVEKEVIDGPNVVQALGSEAEKVTIICECDQETANRVDNLDEEPAVPVRSDRANGTYIPKESSTSKLRTTQEYGPVYRARIELIEATGELER